MRELVVMVVIMTIAISIVYIAFLVQNPTPPSP
jgi:hypothetical protein